MGEIELGCTGLTVSAVGFGGLPIQRLSDEAAVRVVRRCLDLGVSFVETGYAYSTSEERIGRAIRGRRNKPVLATKTMSRDGEEVRKHLALSLERLGVASVELYQFHHVNSEEEYEQVVAPGGPLEVVREARDAEQVGHIGLTSHSMDIALMAVKSGDFETIQFPFNFMANEAAEELIPLASERGVGFIAMKPLAGGALDNATLAFKYLRQFPQILPIPGIERAREMEEIVAVMAGPAKMTASDLEAIDRVKAELSARFCHRCRYCEPCPAGVSIDLLMNLPSFLKRMAAADVVRLFTPLAERAGDCVDCGECEEKCPYDLPIPEMIKEHTALFWSNMALLRYEQDG